jgi:hypothetical protein
MCVRVCMCVCVCRKHEYKNIAHEVDLDLAGASTRTLRLHTLVASSTLRLHTLVASSTLRLHTTWQEPAPVRQARLAQGPPRSGHWQVCVCVFV